MAATTHQATVLVVDDEEHITELVAMGLDYNGFGVERAGSVSQSASNNNCDVVVPNSATSSRRPPDTPGVRAQAITVSR